MGKVVFPGWDGKFLISGVEEENQWWGKSLESPFYKYHPVNSDSDGRIDSFC